MIDVVDSMDNVENFIFDMKDSLASQYSSSWDPGPMRVSYEEAILNCLKAFNLKLPNDGRTDSGETGVFLRQLEYIMQQPLMKEYGDIKFRSMLPVDHQVPNGATQWTWRQYDEKGELRLITDPSADFSMVDVQGEEKQNPIKSYGIGYSVSVQDARQSMFAGVPLESMRAMAARRITERALDKLVCTGSAKLGFSTGFANDSSITAVTKNAQQSGTTWFDSNGGSLADPKEILDDVHGLSKKIFTDTLGRYTGSRLAVGTKTYAFLASKPQSPTFTDASVMTYILRMSPWIKEIVYWPRLDTAGANSKERMLCWDPSPDVARVMIPQEFEQFPPLPVNMAFKILCHVRYGGVAIYRPKAIAYMDGISP